MKGVSFGCYAQVLVYPSHKRCWVLTEHFGCLASKCLLEVVLERYRDHLVFNTWRQLVGLGCEVVFEYFGRDVAQVLVAQCGEYTECACLIVLVAYQEVDDSLLVATCLDEVFRCLWIYLLCLLLCEECSRVGFAY